MVTVHCFESKKGFVWFHLFFVNNVHIDDEKTYVYQANLLYKRIDV